MPLTCNMGTTDLTQVAHTVAAQDCHMGPTGLPDGVVFSTPLTDRVFADTGVCIISRHRKQLGKGNVA